MKTGHKWVYIALCATLVFFSGTLPTRAGQLSYIHSDEEPYEDYAERVMALRRHITVLMNKEPFPSDTFSDLLLNVDVTSPETVAKIRIILCQIREMTTQGDDRLLKLAPIFVEMICRRYDKVDVGISPLRRLVDAGDEALPYLKKLLECPNISKSLERSLRNRIDEIEYRTLGIESMTFP